MNRYLALSSRNAYLSPQELEKRRLKAECDNPGPAARRGTQALLDAGFDKVDYLEQRWGRTLAAAWLVKRA